MGRYDTSTRSTGRRGTVCLSSPSWKMWVALHPICMLGRTNSSHVELRAQPLGKVPFPLDVTSVCDTLESMRGRILPARKLVSKCLSKLLSTYLFEIPRKKMKYLKSHEKQMWPKGHRVGRDAFLFSPCIPSAELNLTIFGGTIFGGTIIGGNHCVCEVAEHCSRDVWVCGFVNRDGVRVGAFQVEGRDEAPVLFERRERLTHAIEHGICALEVGNVGMERGAVVCASRVRKCCVYHLHIRHHVVGGRGLHRRR
mmetsp:Transcript_23633/g.58741  ORF Transcript_23633/g.58741 Transcript_23633/m.58741 type:complete len:254 (+) Transcript_23633:665-1426(+)